jgi:hypothetical protein
VLKEHGHAAIVPALSGVPPPYWSGYANVIANAIQNLGPSERPVLVAHSAAGGVTAGVSQALGLGAIRSYIFVDALIPREGVNLCDLAPAAAGVTIEQLQAQATNGVLPAWGSGWPDELWQRLIPDPTLRAEFIQELHATPLALFEERVPWVAGWPDAPCRYLRFSGMYEEAEREAERSGWVTRHMPGNHLEMLVRPAEVAECLIELAAM